MIRSEETWFISTDGARFPTEDACLRRDALCAAIADALALLPARPQHMPHGTYIRHPDLEAVRRARLAILRLAAPECTCTSWVADTIAALEGRRDPVHWSWAGRIISEVSRPLDVAWHRLSTIRCIRARMAAAVFRGSSRGRSRRGPRNGVAMMARIILARTWLVDVVDADGRSVAVPVTDAGHTLHLGRATREGRRGREAVRLTAEQEAEAYRLAEERA